MSNKKLTTETKQLLLKAVIFADENTFHHPKDRLREIIENTEDLCIDDLLIHAFYLVEVINDYKAFLNRNLNEYIDDEDEKQAIHRQIQILNHLEEDYRISSHKLQ